MVTTLSGDSGFLIKTKLSVLVEDFKKKHDQLGVERVTVEDLDFSDFKQSLLSYSLFATSRLVILDQPSASKQFVEEVEEIINSLPETTDVIIIEPSLDKRSSYYKFLKKNNFIVCDNLEGNQLIQWLVDTANKVGGSISSSDAQYLIDRVGDDQLLLNNEIEKIVLYDEKIDRASIELLTVESPATTIFQLLDAAFNNQSKLALSIYDNQRKIKVQPEQILSMFVWQLQLVAVCLSATNQNISELASNTKMSPYSLGKSMQVAKRIDLEKLKKMVKNLLNIDYMSKTISFDLDQALQNFIIETAIS
jgi:DNA polymerase-3 subunit delta